MSGRLAGLKDALKAERQPPVARTADPKPKAATDVVSTRAKARIGKRAKVIHRKPELSRGLY